MPLTKSELAHTAARLHVVEAIAKLFLEELPAPLAEGALESMSVPERRAFRERLALYKGVLQLVRGRGGAAATAGDLTREQIGRLYFDAQATLNRVGEALRKLQALTSDAIEDAPVTAAQKQVWETRLTESLAALDAHVADFPNENEAGEEE